MSNSEAVNPNPNETIHSNKLDRKFPEAVRSQHGGEELYKCYQCGSCAGGCPVGKLDNSYNPRKIIRMTMLGLKDEVLSSNSIWLCASCYTCQERCPQGVEIADLIFAIRNLAVIEKHVPKGFIDQGSMLIESGRIAPITAQVEKSRQTLGLPKVPSASPDAVKKIAAATGFDKLIEKLKESATASAEAKAQ
jgi:heterodisulfide reductase subunit C